MNHSAGLIIIFIIKTTSRSWIKDVITPAVWDECITLQAFFLTLSMLDSVFGIRQLTHIVSGECLWNTERSRRSRSCAHWCVSALSCLVRINPINAGRAILARFVRALTSFKISFKHDWLSLLVRNVCLKMKMMIGESMVRFELDTFTYAVLWVLPLHAGSFLFSLSSSSEHAFKSKSLGVRGISLLVIWFSLAGSRWLCVEEEWGSVVLFVWLPGNISPMNSCSIPASSPSTSLLSHVSLTK